MLPQVAHVGGCASPSSSKRRQCRWGRVSVPSALSCLGRPTHANGRAVSVESDGCPHVEAQHLGWVAAHTHGSEPRCGSMTVSTRAVEDSRTVYRSRGSPTWIPRPRSARTCRRKGRDRHRSSRPPSDGRRLQYHSTSTQSFRLPLFTFDGCFFWGIRIGRPSTGQRRLTRLNASSDAHGRRLTRTARRSRPDHGARAVGDREMYLRRCSGSGSDPLWSEELPDPLEHLRGDEPRQ